MEQNNKLYLTSNETILFDTNYRYIISTLESNQINKKGTIITTLNNFTKFCQELQFNPDIIIKIIGKKLSCKTAIDKNTKLYYLQGKFNHSEINEIVYNFIQKYLLCFQCDKPEVLLKAKPDKIKQKCKACGNKCYLNVIDNDLDIISILFKNKDLL